MNFPFLCGMNAHGSNNTYCFAFVALLMVGQSLQTDAQVFQTQIPNASVLALGNSNLTQSPDVNGFANAASLSNGAGSGVAVSSALPYSIGGWHSAQAQAWHSPNSTTGLGLSFASAGIDAYREQQIGFYAGKKLMRNLWLSGEFYWMSRNAQEYGNLNALTFGLSALSQPTSKVLVALQVFNPIRAKLGAAEMPTRISTGFTFLFSENTKAHLAIQKELDRPLELRAGVEYQPLDKIALRIGYRGQPARPAFGLGWQASKNIRLDAATEWHTILGLTPSLGLVVLSGK